MGASKREFTEQRETEMDVFCIMKENTYLEIPIETRLKFISSEHREHNEYEAHKDDPKYKELYKTQREAKTKVQEYLFEKRHNKK